MFQFNFGNPPSNQINLEELYNQRLQICKFCIHRNSIMDSCNQSEKIISIYAKNFNRKCPIGKWP
jgi:hypothetical protein